MLVSAVPMNVIIPTCNGVDNLERTLQQLQLYTRSSFKILIVENGSTEIQKNRLEGLVRGYSAVLDIQLIRSRKGFGSAIRASVDFLDYEISWITGDDLPFGFSQFEQITFPVDEGSVFVSSKAHIDSIVKRSWYRDFYSLLFRLLRFCVLGMSIRDTQGDFLISTKSLRFFAPLTVESGFLFTTELSYFLYKSNIQVVEIPVTLSKIESKSRVRLKDLIDMSVGTFRIKGHWSRIEQ